MAYNDVTVGPMPSGDFIAGKTVVDLCLTTARPTLGWSCRGAGGVSAKTSERQSGVLRITNCPIAKRTRKGQ